MLIFSCIFEKKRFEGFEVREYEPQLWASYETRHEGFYPSGNSGFRKLFKYITGENHKKEKMSMTVPVMCDFDERQSSFKMSFYVPTKFQERSSPPSAPSDEQVFIESKGTTVAVLPFAGRVSDDTLKSNLSKLKNLLDQNGLHYDEKNYTVAVYHAPFRIWFRFAFIFH